MTSDTHIAGPTARLAFDRIRAAAREPVEILGEPPPGWHRSRVHPRTVVDAAPRVVLDPRYRLEGYQWYRDGNARGMVFALPVDAPAVLSVAAEDGTIEEPQGALPDLAPALRFADLGSGLAPLERSFVLRELRDLGALWHGIRWGHHELVTNLNEVRDLLVTNLSEVRDLQWQGAPPRTLEPVAVHGPATRLTFYTLCLLGTIRLVRHEEVHAVRDGSVTSTQETIASGGFGGVP